MKKTPSPEYIRHFERALVAYNERAIADYKELDVRELALLERMKRSQNEREM